MNKPMPEDRNDRKQDSTQIPMPDPVKRVFDGLEDFGDEAYLVGGCVRDSLRGVKPHDYDITTSAKPEVILERFEHAVPTGLKHGTITVVEEGEPIEVTTMRKESEYLDHRHPASVEFTDSIDEDLGRRDFTINAMAWNPSTGLVDPYDGKDDLKKNLIRAVGDPQVRFEEDALRMFRAFRFAARLQGKIEEKTLQAIDEKAPLSSTLAAERVAPEIEAVLRDDPHLIKEMLPILDPWIPELKIMNDTPQNSPYHYANVLDHTLDALAALPEKTPAILWAALLHDSGKPDVRHRDENGRDHFNHHEQQSAKRAIPILEKLKLPAKVQKEAVRLIRDHDTFYAPRLQNLYKLRVVKGYDDDLVHALFALQEGDIRAHAKLDRLDDLNRFRDFYEREKNLHPLSLGELKIDGNDAKALGLSGKQIKEALMEVLHQAIVRKDVETREQQLKVLEKIADQIQNRKEKETRTSKSGKQTKTA